MAQSGSGTRAHWWHVLRMCRSIWNTSSLFLKYYIVCYGSSQFTESPLHCFCNNLGVITTVSDMLMQTITQPNKATNDDRDIYLVICDAVKQCAQLQPSFLHVLGHQDKDPKRTLMTIEKSWTSNVITGQSNIYKSIQHIFRKPSPPWSTTPYHHPRKADLQKVHSSYQNCCIHSGIPNVPTF